MIRKTAPALHRLAFAATTLFAVAGAANAADLYKWTDDKGVLHYSDTPPPTGNKAEHMRVNKGVTSDVEDATPPPAADAGKDKPPAKTEAPPPPPAALPDTPEGRQRLCDQSKATLELLQSKFQVADSTGKPLDEKARADRVAAEKQNSATFCSSP